MITSRTIVIPHRLDALARTERLEDEMAKRNRRRRRRPTHPAARAALWVVRFVLSGIYYVFGPMVLLGGIFFAWNGFGLPGSMPEMTHPAIAVVGMILVPLGILWFIFFPRLIERVTGRGPIDPPPGTF
jgi:hypothetical protein